jgi:hypothetical protein
MAGSLGGHCVTGAHFGNLFKHFAFMHFGKLPNNEATHEEEVASMVQVGGCQSSYSRCRCRSFHRGWYGAWSRTVVATMMLYCEMFLGSFCPAAIGVAP